MAPRPPAIEPPATPPTPALLSPGTGPPELSFQLVCDDYDDSHGHDRDRDADKEHDHRHGYGSHDTHDTHGYLLAASPRSSPATFLHPHHSTSLSPPSPDPVFTMATDDGLTNTGADAPAPKNPFNFQTQFISAGPVKSNIGQRRGHRYKHSSISAQHQIFQEPPPRPPPVLPASLPIPTFKEAWASMQRDQRARLWWCCCHAAVAMYVLFSAEGSLAMTALSHLVFFDVGSAAVCVAVDVLGNFEVWRRSSIRHPFGLQRAEVLAGFAMSVFLVFGGFDLISHNLKNFLETVGDHAPHHPTTLATPDLADHPGTNPLANPTGGGGGHGHGHGARYISPGTVDLASLAAIASTLVSAYGLRNHNRIRRVMRVPFPYLANLLPGGAGSILSNPFHFLTLCFSFLMLLLPLVSLPHFVWLDALICAAISASMFVLGTRLAVAQGLMLLMSYGGAAGTAPPPLTTPTTATAATTIKKPPKPLDNRNDNAAVSSVLREIESEPHVARVEEAQFWQVHYGLAMANLKVRLAPRGGGSGGAAADDSTLSQLHARLARVVQNRLGEGYGRGGNLRWEVTVQTCSDG
ncbi:cation efflux family-domain-containing protein [Staphylotrichum tortipilum]|uniref:Zinc transporter n=1 Tax=Staphylotrichum tortipilum TaxID=2831512 RepID=A0AAN6RRX1_9PEZI|nr:cation efflux family-domain-containing protein [Staphylotrichum longicolle]